MTGRAVGYAAALLLAGCASAPLPPSPPVPPPAPSPVPYAAGLIREGQVFDQGVTTCAAMTGKVAFVWGDNRGCSPMGGLVLGQYYPAYRLDRSTTLESMYGAHPDLIAYLADGKTVAWEFGDVGAVPIDITSPVAEALQLAQIAAARASRNQLDFDNVDAEKAPYVGTYVGATAPCAVAARPACGGMWTPRFTMAPDDPAWEPANLAHIQRLVSAAKAAGMAVMINNSANSTAVLVVDQEALAAAAGASMTEGWPFDLAANDPGSDWFMGQSGDAQFDREYQEMVEESADPTFMVAYLNHPLSQATPGEIAYVVATRLLTMVNPPINYLAFGGKADLQGVEVYPASANPAIGPITEPPPPAGSRPYVRHFAHGCVALNPSSTTAYQGCGQALGPLSAVIVEAP